MLKKLYVQNFALIDRLEIELQSGFSVVTGETGAGKSIIIDAVDMVTGGQGLTEFIRSGEEKAVIEGFFEIEGNQKAVSVLDEYGFLPEEGELLILTRELVKTGKNICRINGRQVNLSVFKDVARNLVDIYGQHHQQSLLDPQKHIELLDEYGGRELLVLKERVAELFEQYNSLHTKLNEMEASEKEQARTADMYRFQLEEIDNCRLKPDEDASLTEEKHLLAHAERLAQLTNTVYEIVYEGHKQNPATDLLHEALHACKEAAAIDGALLPICESIETSLYQLIEAAREIKGYSDKVDSNPDRLEEVESRLNLIGQLKKKYGDTIGEILDYKDKIASSLALFENYDEELAAVKQALAEAENEYNTAAGLLTSERKKAAVQLKVQITQELKQLNMPYVTFDVQLSRRKAPGSSGVDDVEFMISPNKGEPLKPLAKIVSGGEVSRIMLAFKSILAKIDSVSTLIFDEVDAGIGGHALQAVAQKLAAIGQDRQVVCVTHAPQIAGSGDHHYRAVKEVNGDRTITVVEKLSTDQRVDEIARMLVGGTVTEVTKKHAQEILKTGTRFKEPRLF